MLLGGAIAFGWQFRAAVSAALLVVIVGLVVVAAAYRVRRALVVKRFRESYLKQGRDLLIVYTESPHWQPRIESHWLPRWADRAVVVNRSQPWSEDRPEIALWNAFKGYREHTPIAIVVPARGRPRVIPFFLAFRAFKHGKERPLLDAEQALASALAASARVGA